VRRLIITTAMLVPLAFAVAACGGSSSPSPESAHATACEAMADIQVQIAQLQSYTRSNVTADAVQGTLDKIGTDLQTIEDSIPDQTKGLQKKIEIALDGFRKKLGDSLTDGSAGAAAAKKNPGGPQAQFTPFATHYVQTFGFVPCKGLQG
jgi:hypothetical protein